MKCPNKPRNRQRRSTLNLSRNTVYGKGGDATIQAGIIYKLQFLCKFSELNKKTGFEIIREDMLQYKLEEWKVKVGCQSFLSLISKVLRLVLTLHGPIFFW